MRRLKTRACTQDRMRESNYRKYTTPMSFSDEKFIQISSFVPNVKDYYWISNYGRMYSSYIDRFMETDLARERTHTVLSMKNGTSEVFDMRELYYQAFSRYYN